MVRVPCRPHLAHSEGEMASSAPSDALTTLRCPACRGSLNRNPGTLVCASCSEIFSISEGFPDFVQQGNLDWGELSDSEMRQVVDVARAEGWYVPLLELGEKDPYLAYYILDKSRMSWVFHCLRERDNDVCIDLGSGWGNIAFSLADHFRTVWSVEPVRTRVQFQQIRRLQEPRPNVFPIRSEVLSLPFPDNTADVVVCNGLLEWIGIGDLTQPVQILQDAFLREAFRVLKQGGCLYIGIENRFSATSFLGARDHSGIPYTNLLPRKIADIVIRRYRPKSDRLTYEARTIQTWPNYRTYTYSLSGYRRLLKKAGFSTIESRWVWPNYNAPHFSGPFASQPLSFLATDVSKHSSNRMAGIGARLLRILPDHQKNTFSEVVWPCFLLFAYKGHKPPTLSDAVNNKQKDSFVLASTTRISAPKHSFLLLKNSKVSNVVTIRRATEEPVTAPSRFFPTESRILGEYRLETQRGVPGTTLDPLVSANTSKAIDWLCRFQKQNAQGSFTVDNWMEEEQSLRKFLRDQHLGQELLALVEPHFIGVKEIAKQGKVPLTAEHGDFQYRNVLVDSGGTLVVIDWDDARSLGNPLVDIGTYIATMPRGNIEQLRQMASSQGRLAAAAQAACETYKRFWNLEDLQMQAIIGYALTRALLRDSLELTANGLTIRKAFPGAGRIAVRSLNALQTVAK